WQTFQGSARIAWTPRHRWQVVLSAEGSFPQTPLLRAGRSRSHMSSRRASVGARRGLPSMQQPARDSRAAPSDSFSGKSGTVFVRAGLTTARAGEYSNEIRPPSDRMAGRTWDGAKRGKIPAGHGAL